MNEDRIKVNGNSFPANSRRSGGKLTDNDLKQAEGNSEYLVGRLQERYGIARDEAARQVREFQKGL